MELTPREAEILQFIATGMSNKEIAATAFVSLSTVKTHINHIFQKLDVGNRKDMIQQSPGAGDYLRPDTLFSPALQLHPKLSSSTPNFNPLG